MSLPSYIEAPADADGVYAIYPGDGIPDDSRDATWHEHQMEVTPRNGGAPMLMVHNVTLPTLTLFRPDPAIATGASIIIAPGGAFRFQMMDHEGYDMARAVAATGMTAFVLRYRVMHTPDTEEEMHAYYRELGKELPVQDLSEMRAPVGNEESEAARPWAEADGLQAVRWVRAHADELGIDPGRIGIAGFSAGGGVTIAAATIYDAESRPDFAVGIYPGYRRDVPVPADAPPLFLAAADGDILVSPGSTAALYQAWHNAGRTVELHIFSNGAHGFGMLPGEPNEQWFALFLRWLDALSIHPATQRTAS